MLAGATAFFALDVRGADAADRAGRRGRRGRRTHGPHRAARRASARGWAPRARGPSRRSWPTPQASTSRTEVTALSAAVIVWGATRLFSNLQRALDHLWGVRARDHEALRDKAVKQVKRRALSFALVTLCGTALVVAIAVRTAFSAAERLLPVALPTRWHLLDHGLSLGALEGALRAWSFGCCRTCASRGATRCVGAAVTTVLFALGRVAREPVPRAQEPRLGLWRRGLGGAAAAVGVLLRRRSSSSARPSSRRAPGTSGAPSCPPTTPSPYAKTTGPDTLSPDAVPSAAPL
jgi:hypothetical protein